MAPDEKTDVYPPSEESSSRAHIKNLDKYREMYERSIEDPDGFWLTKHTSLGKTQLESIGYGR